jgi:hypothetical protein
MTITWGEGKGAIIRKFSKFWNEKLTSELRSRNIFP